MRLSSDERAILLASLRSPRGRYLARRASQLAGVPQRTVYDWAREKVLVPDFAQRQPRVWSYRDLVFLRLIAWLRTKGMPRPDAAHLVRGVRALLGSGADFTEVRSDGQALFLGEADVDHMTGQSAMRLILPLLDRFELALPRELKELGRSRLWGPNLVHPSSRSTISPEVLAGEPCVTDTRIPTSTIFTLWTSRGLEPSAIVRLYPALSDEDVKDAISLEGKLRSQVPVAA